VVANSKSWKNLNTEGLANLGFWTKKPVLFRGCPFCEILLTEVAHHMTAIEVRDLFICGECSRVYVENETGLLVYIGVQSCSRQRGV
jgi:hypothetical protein